MINIFMLVVGQYMKEIKNSKTIDAKKNNFHPALKKSLELTRPVDGINHAGWGGYNC